MIRRGFIDNSKAYDTIAEVYDFLIPDPPGMIEFYRDMVQKSGGGPVLEVGCGTGRLSLCLAHDDIQVVGVDLSGQMLNVLRSKLNACPKRVRENITLFHADMLELELETSFPIVFFTGGTIQHCLTSSDYDRAISMARRHLQKGGVLVIDTENEPKTTASNHYRVDYGTYSGEYICPSWYRISSWNEFSIEPLNRLFKVTACFKVIGRRGRLIGNYRFDTTFTYPGRSELVKILEKQGFNIVCVMGDYVSGTDHDNPLYSIIVAKNAEENRR